MLRLGSCAASASTTSISPASATASSSSSMSVSHGLLLRHDARGVNRLATSARCSAWPGSSWAIMLSSSGDHIER